MLPTNWCCFVINLANSRKRLKAIAAQLNEAGINFERFEAVDGPTIDPDAYRFLTARDMSDGMGKSQQHEKLPAS